MQTTTVENCNVATGVRLEDVKIDPEIRDLLPPLSADERQGLHSDIQTTRIVRDPFIVWRGHNILVDGHHRRVPTLKYGAEYRIIEMDFADRHEVMRWIQDNQGSRRNLKPFARFFNESRFLHLVQQQAKERMRSGIRQNHGQSTASHVAHVCGVSERTANKYLYLWKHAPPELLKAVRDDEISVDKAYQSLKQCQRQEITVRESTYKTHKTVPYEAVCQWDDRFVEALESMHNAAMEGVGDIAETERNEFSVTITYVVNHTQTIQRTQREWRDTWTKPIW